MKTHFRAAAGAAMVIALVAGFAAAAGPDDRATAEAALREVEASARKDVAAEMVTRAKAAQERAGKLRAHGDEPHARLADGLARTWAEAARDTLRAVEAEDKAQVARRQATDAGVIADRERALLEEGIAQTGRLKAQLEAAPREAKEQPTRTSAAAASAGASAGATRSGGAKGAAAAGAKGTKDAGAEGTGAKGAGAEDAGAAKNASGGRAKDGGVK